MLSISSMEVPRRDSAADTSTDAHKKELIPYLHLSQGQGSIFTLPFYVHDGLDVDCIGTHSCWTCVCVYVRLDDQRCFVAHIDGHTRSYREELEWIPENHDQRSLLKAHIAQELNKVLPNPYQNKSVAKKDELKDSIVIVCPRMTVAHPYSGLEVEATGAVTVQAIREHFELATPSKNEDLAHGFVVNHKTQEVTKLGWDQAVQPTRENFLDTDRAMHKFRNNRSDVDHALLQKHPLMLTPEEKGFLELPGRPWTAVYDRQTLDWRRMALPDFFPFIPLPYDSEQQAVEEGEVRSKRDGKVILGLPARQDKPS